MSIKIVSDHCNKVYPSKRGPVVALKDFNLEVTEGEFLCIIGPSGCGKSTFLRILAGLVPPSSGEVRIIPGNRDEKKPINNVIFQEYAIFPWKVVKDNVAFGLQMRGVPKKEREEIAMEWINRVGLTKFATCYPHELSGGMKQRVSIARAFANDPEVLLMDEPLGALDAQTRSVLQEELIRIWEGDQKTVVYITHGIEESILLGDRIILMTAHPGTKKKEYKVEFPRPRGIELTRTQEFGEFRYAIWKALETEVRQAMESQ